MGWFWGSSGSDTGNDKTQDPLRTLDPELRDFLAKESPVKYGTSNPPATPRVAAPRVAAPQPLQKPESIVIPTPSSEPESKPIVPPESLFQDGRYAHIWKHYRPQADIENETKSDQEKILDVVDGYKHRKAEIGKAAIESCALEQWAVQECFTNGGVKSRMSMCRTENRAFDRCYQMQSKFLKALGYLSIQDRPPEIDEAIQMHADKLYHQMIDQEKAIEAAKAEGKPIPTFAPLLSSRVPNIPKAQDPAAYLSGLDVDVSKLPAGTQEALKKRLDGLEGLDREVEERAIKAELQSGNQLKTQVERIWERQDTERQQRKEDGKATLGDKFTDLLRFRPTFEKPKENVSEQPKDEKRDEKGS